MRPHPMRLRQTVARRLPATAYCTAVWRRRSRTRSCSPSCRCCRCWGPTTSVSCRQRSALAFPNVLKFQNMHQLDAANSLTALCQELQLLRSAGGGAAAQAGRLIVQSFIDRQHAGVEAEFRFALPMLGTKCAMGNNGICQMCSSIGLHWSPYVHVLCMLREQHNGPARVAARNVCSRT